MASLLAHLDASDLSLGLDFYHRVSAAFSKACLSILFLRMYAADGRRFYGVSGGPLRAVPYAGETVADAPRLPEPPRIDDEEAYHKNLRRWLDGGDGQKGDARQFFWNAFAASQVVETIEEAEHDGEGWTREFRKAHHFLYSVLSSGVSEPDFNGIVQLLLSCRSGWPHPLAEILVRHGRNASPFRQGMICYALGEIGSAPHSSVREFVEARTRSSNFTLRLQAAIALNPAAVRGVRERPTRQSPCSKPL